MFTENQIIKDEYRIIRKIGEGGMGTVYLAEDIHMQQEVAIKLLHPALTTDPEIVERFKTEAKAQYKLTHPYIVKLTRLVQYGDDYFIVMEYVDGMTLKEMLRKTGLLPEDRALPIFHKILRGLAYAHSQGIIHRDIKPGNIIIDGKSGNPKITDFGIAKILGDKGMTQTGTKLGTVYYMSPEQIKNPKAVDQRTDVYSLGVTLYEMLTGNLPYNTGLDSEYDLMNEIVNTPIKNPLDYYPHISPGVVKMIYHMTAKDKSTRFGHCEEYIDFHLRNANEEKQTPSQKVSSGSASFLLLLALTAVVVLLFIFGNDLTKMIKGGKIVKDTVTVNKDSIDKVEFDKLQREKEKMRRDKEARAKKDSIDAAKADTLKKKKPAVDEETIPPDSTQN